MAFLPFLFFLITGLIFFTQSPSGIRESLLKSALTVFVITWLDTEVLSSFHLITFQVVLISWIAFNLVAVGWLVWIFSKQNPNSAESRKQVLKNPLTGLSGISVLCLMIILLVGGITLYIALKAPPNNFDSMTYHMARIPHWIQDQNIGYYPTSIPRQNYSLPLSEYSILHLQLLSKGDHFANLIQWFSFMMAILSSSLIAKQLKLSSQGQWIAGALTATLPMAILQSTSTQNDLVVSLFCLGFSYFLVKTIKAPSWKSSSFAAIALGLALGTKGTAYIFCAGIGLGLGGWELVGKTWKEIKRLGMHYGMIIAVALTLNAGIYLRNWQLYRHPLITSNERVLVDEISGKIMLANAFRNSVMNLASPLPALNRALEGAAEGLLGFQTNNPASTFQDTQFSLSFSINEDDAGNGLHLILIFLCALILPWKRTDNQQDLNRYLATLLFTFLVYSLAFKWQPWGGRLQTPLFMFGVIAPASLLDRGSSKILPGILLGLFLLASTPYLALNSIRPLIPFWEDGSLFIDEDGERKFLRSLNRYPSLDERLDSFLSVFYEGRSVNFTERRELYFLGDFNQFDAYNLVGHYLRNTPAREIGLVMDSNDWEYPLWVFVNQHASPGPLQFTHVDVDNVSKSIRSRSSGSPELIIVTRKDYQDLKFLSNYQEVLSAGSIKIFQPQE